MRFFFPNIQDDAIINQVFAFFMCYMALLGVFSLVMAGLGLDVLSAFSGSLACLSNIGPGLGQFGPASNYASVCPAGKWVLSLAMLTGRLEITPVLILLLPSTWRK